MPNAIELAKQFVPILDEVYKMASLTAKLDGAAELVRAGANANELIIPMLDMQGLGDYSRNSGYVDGDVTLTNETVKCNFDRGRMFNVDYMDNLETAGIAFGRLSGEFIRTKVVPELDAFRFARSGRLWRLRFSILSWTLSTANIMRRRWSDACGSSTGEGRTHPAKPLSWWTGSRISSTS